MARIRPTTELSLGGVWTDISKYVRTSSGIEISRGRANEQSAPEPAACTFTVNNQDGRFSPRNPSGAYYGLIGRNTPVRVSVRAGGVRLWNPTGSSASATAPDTAGLSITGDIDIQVDLRLQTWLATATPADKRTDPTQRSWVLQVTAAGLLQFFWTADGASYLSALSTAAVPLLAGRQAVRVTLDVDNGASGRTVTFYTAPTIAGPWTQLGAPVVQAGVTSIFDSTAPVGVYAGPGGEVYALKILQGIAGTERANPDFTAQAEGATSFADAAGNTWTRVGSSLVTSRRYRFVGEVSSWPIGWDHSENDVFVGVSAAGIRRRLGQGAAVLKSPIRRSFTGTANVAAYWPMEDGSDATQFGQGLSAGEAMVISGAVSPAESSDIFDGSDPLPVFNGGYATARFSGLPIVQLRFLGYAPTGSVPANGSLLASIQFAGGNVGRIDVAISNLGSLAMSAYDPAGAFIDGTGYIAFNVFDKAIRFSVGAHQNGGNVELLLSTMEQRLTAGGLQGLTLIGRTLGSAIGVTAAPVGTGILGPLTGVTLGHFLVQSAETDYYENAAALDGYAGDSAAARATRLAAEAGVPLTIRGPSATSTLLGVQQQDTVLNLIDSAAETDGGISSEEITSARLMFRTRETLYGQTPIVLPYGRLRDLQPVDDDQRVINDLTVNRIGGATARYEIGIGPLSTQAPPNGVGRYDSTLDLSLYADSQAAEQAAWRLHVATVDETRYPVIGVEMVRLTTAEQTSMLDMVEGDAIAITSPPTFAGSPDTITQLVAGWTEVITPSTYTFTLTGIPASPYDTGNWDTASARYSGNASTTTGSFTSTATGAAAFSITTPPGEPLWTSTPADFPLDLMVAGERITVSAIANTASPQAVTVSARSVNGVVKAHSAAEPVQLADPTYYAL